MTLEVVGGGEVARESCPIEVVTLKLFGVRVQPKVSGDNFPGG